MKRNIYLIVAAIMLLQLPLTGRAAQNKDLMKANYLYSHLAFHEAISYYEKVAGETPNEADAMVYAHLGDCYRLTKDARGASAAYAKAVTMPQTTDETRLHYAQVLMTLQRYDEAADMLKQCQAGMPGDRRVINMLEGCSKAMSIVNGVPEGTADLLGFNTDGSDFGPALWEKQLVFTTDSVLSGASKKDNWTGMPYYNIYSIACNMGGRCSGEFEQMGGKVNTEYHDGPAMFTKDGNQMYFTRTTLVNQFFSRTPVSDPSGTVRLQIMIAEDYDAVEKKFKKITPFRYNNKNYSTAHPAISPDGSMLIFSSDMSGGEGGTDLYMCRRSGNDWSQPMNMGRSVNTEGEEMFPVFISNTTISFASDGLPGIGGLDVYYSTWSEQSQSWSQPESAGTPVNSSYDDMSLTMYNDGRNGYFSSNRPASKRSDNIYHFFKQKIYLSLKIVDSFTNKELNGAVVNLQSIPDKRNLITDWGGTVTTNLFPQTKYDITIKKQGYKTAITTLSTIGLTGASDTLEGTVMLVPDYEISYNVTVLDKDNYQPIETPTLTITKDGGQSETIELQTGETYRKDLEPGTLYQVQASKDNYYANDKTVSTKKYTPQSGTVVISDTILMCKVAVGSICQIENIYYDYDKWNIREDAKPALNQLLKLLKQYPKMTIQLNSHTDCRGSDGYNMTLSKRRAQSVIKYLGTRGIKMNRMKAKGYGETMPVIKCNPCESCSEEQQQKNRRTEFQILKL